MRSFSRFVDARHILAASPSTLVLLLRESLPRAADAEGTGDEEVG